MAARKSLGKGLDSMFPDYSHKTQKENDQVAEKKNSAKSKKKSEALSDIKENVQDTASDDMAEPSDTGNEAAGAADHSDDTMQQRSDNGVFEESSDNGILEESPEETTFAAKPTDEGKTAVESEKQNDSGNDGKAESDAAAETSGKSESGEGSGISGGTGSDTGSGISGRTGSDTGSGISVSEKSQGSSGTVNLSDIQENPGLSKETGNEDHSYDRQGGTFKLRISEIEPNRKQPRKYFDEDALVELADSIRQYGVIQPLIVQPRDDYYEIVAGERRWRAAKLAGLKEVPVILRSYSDQEIVEISLIENIQRENLNPIEEAKAYQRLLTEFELKQDEVAEKVAKSRTTITNSLRLLNLDTRVQEMMIQDMITAGHARALLSLDSKEMQYEIAQKIMDEKLSVREVEKLIRTLLNKEKRTMGRHFDAPNPALNYIYQDMEEKMKAILGTKVTVNRKTDKRGKIEIEYYSNEEFDRIYELLSSISQ